MATNLAVSIEARLVKLLGWESCEDYFNEAVGGDSVMGISADVKNACTMESIVDKILLEIGDAFELHKQQQEATTKPSTLVYGFNMVCCATNWERSCWSKKTQCTQEDQNSH